MFFNLDKNSKQNLLNEYKQEAQNYYQKKKEERQRRIQEEREYLAQRELLEKEADEKVYREKMKKKNAQMKEYQTMLKNKSNFPGYRHNSNKNDIVLNNWGGQERNYLTIPRVQSQTQINNQNFGSIIIPQGKQDSPWRGRRRGYKNEDHMRNLLNDNRNDQEINNHIKEENEYKQKLYKDLLFSQYEEAKSKNLNLYGTNDPLILERKRKRHLSENPYAKKSTYEFGKSNLTHNPITDPQNNIYYNKYLKFSESSKNLNNRNYNYQMKNNSIEQNFGNSNYINNYNNINKTNYNNISNNNYSRINNNNNYNNNSNKIQPLEEFKGNNYDTTNLNFWNDINNNNCNQNAFNGNNYNTNLISEGNKTTQNQNNGYMNNPFRPTPSGERIRQAAASNFF